MRKLFLASSLFLGLLLASSSAFAGGRTFNLGTVLSRPLGVLFLKDFRERTVTVRAPRGTGISKQTGTPGGRINPFVPVPFKPNAKHTHVLFKLGLGKYYVSPNNNSFSILRSPILTTR